MSSRKNYLLAAGAPTPNGRLHLGHIGAQFLKLDVLKRHYVRGGDAATLMFSADSFDNPITFAARKEGMSETELCRIYCARIAQDLQNVAIDYDLFLDASEEGRESVHRALTELDGLLAGRKVTVTEKIPYSRHTGQPLTGRFLAGECPTCARSMHGYSCDPCGVYYSPEDIREVRPADPADVIEWRQVTNEFVRTDTAKVLEYVRSLPLPPVTRRKADDIAADLLAGEHILARWTASEPLGLPTGSDEQHQVYFNRVLIGLAEMVVFGEVTKDRLGLAVNAFEEGSGTVTVFAYGTDNLGSLLIENTAHALATGKYRPYDHHLVSEFVLLDGQKMSTSRPHAIWVAELAEQEGFRRDALRAYMASIGEPDVEVDVSPVELPRFMASVSERADRVLVASASAGGRAHEADADVIALAEKNLDGQDTALQLPRVDLAGVWRLVDEWADRVLVPGGERSFTDLACFAVIAAPVMPDTAREVWRLLGLPGEPDRAALRRLAEDAD